MMIKLTTATSLPLFFVTLSIFIKIFFSKSSPLSQARKINFYISTDAFDQHQQSTFLPRLKGSLWTEPAESQANQSQYAQRPWTQPGLCSYPWRKKRQQPIAGHDLLNSIACATTHSVVSSKARRCSSMVNFREGRSALVAITKLEFGESWLLITSSPSYLVPRAGEKRHPHVMLLKLLNDGLFPACK